jgi:hypothetical protein
MVTNRTTKAQQAAKAEAEAADALALSTTTTAWDLVAGKGGSAEEILAAAIVLGAEIDRTEATAERAIWDAYRRFGTAITRYYMAEAKAKVPAATRRWGDVRPVLGFAGLGTGQTWAGRSVDSCKRAWTIAVTLGTDAEYTARLAAIAAVKATAAEAKAHADEVNADEASTDEAKAKAKADAHRAAEVVKAKAYQSGVLALTAFGEAKRDNRIKADGAVEPGSNRGGTGTTTTEATPDPRIAQDVALIAGKSVAPVAPGISGAVLAALTAAEAKHLIAVLTAAVAEATSPFAAEATADPKAEAMALLMAEMAAMQAKMAALNA